MNVSCSIQADFKEQADFIQEFLNRPLSLSMDRRSLAAPRMLKL